MKVNRIVMIAAWALLVLAFFACESIDNETPAPVAENNDQGNSAMLNNGSVRDRVFGNGLGGPMGFIYGRFLQDENGRGSDVISTMRAYKSNKMSTLNARAASDSLDNEFDCYVETYTETASTYEYVLDFGNGCEFEGEFLKGKLTERGSFTETTFQNEVIYAGFGGSDWEISGTESYEGTWSHIEGVDEEAEEDWDAEYTFTSDLTQLFTEDSFTEEIIFQASGSEKWDQNGFTVLSLTESGSANSGFSFEMTVDVPLYMDFSCEEDEVFVFVSGIESGSFTYTDEGGNTVTGTHSTDFGDGTCDNLVTFTEDGVSETIDLAEFWDIECEEGHDDEWDEDEEEDDYEDEEEFEVAFYEINEELTPNNDGSAFLSGKLTLEIDSAELVSIEFQEDLATVTYSEEDEVIEASYEIIEVPSKEGDCDFYTSGVIVLEAEDEIAIIEFMGDTCNNTAYIYYGDEEGDEEDEEDDNEEENSDD